MKPERLFLAQPLVGKEGACGQRDEQKPVQGRQQTALGSKPGMGVCARKNGKQVSARVTRTWIINSKTKQNSAQRQGGLQKGPGSHLDSGQVSCRMSGDE